MTARAIDASLQRPGSAAWRLASRPPKKLKKVLQVINDEHELLDLAKHTVRSSQDDEPFVAAIAARRIQDPKRLLELALGATEYEVSRIAVARLHDDSLLLQIMAHIEDEEEKWFSPLDVQGDKRVWHEQIRMLAARWLTDRSPLVELALADKSCAHHANGHPINDRISPLRACCLELLAERPELLARYVEQETDIRALHHVAQVARDALSLEILVRSIEEGRVETYESRDGSDPLGSLERFARWRLSVARHVKEAWARFDALPEERREAARSRAFGYRAGGASFGWSEVRITVGNEVHHCNVSDIGPSTADFESFVLGLRDGDYDGFRWAGEPGGHEWFLARRDPFLYVEVPGADEGSYLLMDSFAREVVGQQLWSRWGSQTCPSCGAQGCCCATVQREYLMPTENRRPWRPELSYRDTVFSCARCGYEAIVR